MRLFSVSEPMEFRLPETPLVFSYALMSGSTWTVCACMGAARKIAAAARHDFWISFMVCCFMGIGA